MEFINPTTITTDYLMSAIGIFFSYRLFVLYRNARQTSSLLWSFAFAFSAAAAAAGGTYHGIVMEPSGFLASLLWKITVYSVGFASFSMLTGTLYAVIQEPFRTPLTVLALAKLLSYGAWMLNHDEFVYVIFDYGTSMLFVLAVELYSLYGQKNKDARWIIAGILVSFVAAAVQQSGMDIHKYFNHNDLYHVIQVAALFLLYRGASLLKDRPNIL